MSNLKSLAIQTCIPTPPQINDVEPQELPANVPDPGMSVLLDPLANKGTAFLWLERERFHLRVALPARMSTMAEQLSIYIVPPR